MESKKNSVFLIRHGESTSNEIRGDNKSKGIKDDSRFNKELLDCGLTEAGIQQAIKIGEKLKDANITLVLVSPLRRALQTAYYAFKDHPSKPKLKVTLNGREIMSSTCSIPDNVEILQKEFPSFDFSELEVLKDKKFWVLDTFEGEDREQIESLIKDLPEGPEKYGKFTDILVESCEKLYPKYLESPSHMVARAMKVKKQLQEHSKLLRDSEKVAYVGHGAMNLSITATRFSKKGYAMDGIHLKNGEFIEFDIGEEVKDKQ